MGTHPPTIVWQKCVVLFWARLHPRQNIPRYVPKIAHIGLTALKRLRWLFYTICIAVITTELRMWSVICVPCSLIGDYRWLRCCRRSNLPPRRDISRPQRSRLARVLSTHWTAAGRTRTVQCTARRCSLNHAAALTRELPNHCLVSRRTAARQYSTGWPKKVRSLDVVSFHEEMQRRLWRVVWSLTWIYHKFIYSVYTVNWVRPTRNFETRLVACLAMLLASCSSHFPDKFLTRFELGEIWVRTCQSSSFRQVKWSE